MGVKRGTVDEVIDKMAITEILTAYCRAMDRIDTDLAKSCWHDGGTDAHPPLFVGKGHDFAEWVEGVHRTMIVTRHILSNVTIRLGEGEAWSESYWTLTIRKIEDGAEVDWFGGGRYLDHLECIDDVWAIRHRDCLYDWERQEPVPARAEQIGGPGIAATSPASVAIAPSRDRADPSYRILT